MKNLQLIDGIVVSDSSLSKCQHIDVDVDTKQVYVATATGIVSLDVSSKKIVSKVSLVEHGYLTSDGHSFIVNLHYLFERMAVCVTTSGGDILVWSASNSEVECVGSVMFGIKAAAWSPDMDLLVLLTGENQLVSMTREFDPLSEVPLYQTGTGEAELMTVGWGKKETQFHGSEGKMAAVKNSAPVQSLLESDDRRSVISWRGDGQYFVVSTVNPDSGVRQLKIWTRDCVLHSTSEAVDGLGQAISYRPSGGLIAAAIRQHNRHLISFFEKNGLRKNNVDFELQPWTCDIKVVEMHWNLESSVLAVWCEQLNVENSDDNIVPQSCIDLYTMNNYHWYLKQRLEFSPQQGKVSAMRWDLEHAYRLSVTLDSGHYLQYTWTWITNHSVGQSSQDLAAVAVIDGDRVLMTPFRSMIVPPPMCAYYLKLTSPATHVAFQHSKHMSNDLAVLMANGHIAFYTFESNGIVEHRSDSVDETVKIAAAGGPGFKPRCQLPKLKAVTRFKDETSWPLGISHMLWIDGNMLVYCKSHSTVPTVCQAELDWSSHEIITRHTTEMPNSLGIIAMTHNIETGTTAIEASDGHILTFDPESGELKPWHSSLDVSGLQLPQVCQRITLCVLGGQEVVLGLTDRFRLFINDIEVTNNCTSFDIQNEFILVTTHSHICRCIGRHLSGTMVKTFLENAPSNESLRQVERGTRIVCSVPVDTKLVLQMPRGNLELIHPRALVLSTARKYLDQLKFREAFELMKKHRINMNLLYDHNPTHFLENTDLFVRQLDSPANINLFLTDLLKEDVTRTMYHGGYDASQRPTNNDNDKVDIICNSLRQSLEVINSEKYVLSILTTHVKKTSPELELALQRVQCLKDSKSGLVSADEALRYLLYLVDVNELYNVALGTYDFDLVLMVAEKSQKDPKEYLPQLNELRRLEPNYQRYRIDVQLKRYERALTHLVKCGHTRFDECIGFVKQHKLFAQALSLYPINSPEYIQVSSLYAEYLAEKGHVQEAGLIMARVSGDLEHTASAQQLLEKCLDWRRAFVMAAHLPAQDLNAMARRLANKLVEARRHAEAARVLIDYADDYEEAIVTLIAGSQWDEAMRLMYKCKRTDFIETNLKPAISEAFEHQMALVINSESLFSQYCSRLRVVRETKKQQRAALELFGDDGGDAAVGNADIYSDTSSIAESEASVGSSTKSAGSRGSRSSGRTGKSRQKRNRKRWSLKEGSQFEEFALIDALHNLVVQAEQYKEDVSKLVRILVLFFQDNTAHKLQSELDRLLQKIGESYSEIWPLNQEFVSADEVVHGPESTVNTILSRQNLKPTIVQPKDEDALRPPPAVTRDSAWRLSVVDLDMTSDV